MNNRHVISIDVGRDIDRDTYQAASAAPLSPRLDAAQRLLLGAREGHVLGRSLSFSPSLDSWIWSPFCSIREGISTFHLERHGSPLTLHPAQQLPTTVGIRQGRHGCISKGQASGIRHQSSDIKDQGSIVRHQGSGVKDRASTGRHQGSEVKDRASTGRHQGSDFQGSSINR